MENDLIMDAYVISLSLWLRVSTYSLERWKYSSSKAYVFGTLAGTLNLLRISYLSYNFCLNINYNWVGSASITMSTKIEEWNSLQFIIHWNRSLCTPNNMPLFYLLFYNKIILFFFSLKREIKCIPYWTFPGIKGVHIWMLFRRQIHIIYHWYCVQ